MQMPRRNQLEFVKDIFVMFRFWQMEEAVCKKMWFSENNLKLIGEKVVPGAKTTRCLTLGDKEQ
jgi:hypothetical protein